MIGRTHRKEKKDPAILKAFFSLSFFFFLRCNLCFPLAYKRESRAPHEGNRPIETRSDLDPHKSTTRTHG